MKNDLIGEVLVVNAVGSLAHVSKDLVLGTQFGFGLIIHFGQVLFELVVDVVALQFHTG